MNSRIVITTSLLVIGMSTQLAFGRLGSFTAADGYYHFISPPSAAYNWADVTYYNAGASGANAGGGGQAYIAPDSGLWKLVSQNGAHFPTTAARNAFVGGYPPYPTTSPTGTNNSYVVGAHFPGRTGDDDNLALRNDNPPGTGPIVYDYYLDQYDMGVTPATVTSGVVDTQFYFQPTLFIPDNSGGKPRDKFTMSFMDTSGDIGMQWGYTFQNEVYWRLDPSDPWTYTGITANDQSGTFWDGIKISINLSADTFGFDYFDDTTDTWTNIVPAGTALGDAMTDLTRLRWQLEDDDHSAFAGKNYFDDFSFTVAVPEPTSVALFVVALLASASERRRRSA